jgi:selenocysteine lyase/cysteine desulfurase
MVDPFLPEQEKLAAVRDALPATGAGIYLDTAAGGPLPAEVARAMRDADDWEVRVGRAAPGSLEALQARSEEARAVLAAVLGADPDHVALVHDVREGLAAVLTTRSLRDGDRVVATDQEPDGTLRLLRHAAEAAGSALDIVAAGPEVDDDALLAALARAVDGSARLVVVSHVLPTTGRVLPIAELAALAAAHAAWLVVDGSQAAGAVPLSVGELGADVYLAPGHAWLLGPEGVAAMWAGQRAGSAGLLEGRVEIEPGAFHRPSVIGLARAVGWIEMYVGLPWAYERAARLTAHLAARLSAIPGVAILTPDHRRATILAIRVAGWPADDLRDELGGRVFSLVGLVPALDALRLSIAWFNSEPELDRFAATLAEVARHTPHTLPRRPSLVVLGSDAAT